MVVTGVLRTVAATPGVFAAPDPSKVGDLAGNLPAAVYLLIPIALVLAVVTALALGASGEGAATGRRAGGVSRTLRRGSDGDERLAARTPV